MRVERASAIETKYLGWGAVTRLAVAFVYPLTAIGAQR
jgi:hypothetical protein